MFFLISMSLLWEALFSTPCSMESWQKTRMRSVSLMWNLQPFWLCLSKNPFVVVPCLSGLCWLTLSSSAWLNHYYLPVQII